MRVGLTAALLSAALFALYSLPVARSGDRTDRRETEVIPLGLIEPDIPRDNPITHEAVALGERLFFDARFSINRQMSCGTCHRPQHGFSESRSISLAATGQSMRRNAPPIFNTGFQGLLNWDGRFKSLEDQIDGVFSPYGDMGVDLGEAITRVNDDESYRADFRKAYGSEPTSTLFKRAIATYQRSLLTGNSRFDRYLYGNRADALSNDEKSGFELFIGKASCITCHDVFHPRTNNLGGGIALFTDHRFHNLGVGYANGRMPDTGRYEVTQDMADWGSFKTPTLRNIALTAPYMHDGSIESLEALVDFYNRGGTPNPNLSSGIRPLYLNRREQGQIVAFLKSLTDERFTAAASIEKYVPR